MTGRAGAIDLREHLPRQGRRPDAATVSQAFAAALDVLAANGGGSLYVPPGNWPIDRPVNVKTAGVRVYGAGMRATRLRLAPGARCAVVQIRAPGVCLERMTLVGNLPHLSGGRLPNGLAVQGDPAFVELRDIVVEQVARKAISIKGRRETPGAFALNSLRNVVVRLCGDDGIDFKLDRPSRGADRGPPPFGCPGPRAFLRNVSILGFSAHFPRGSLHGENGIDVRGRVHLHNIEIRDVVHGSERAGGATAIVFRGGNHDRAHGAGGAWSVLENYFVSRQSPVPSPVGDAFTLGSASPSKSSRGIAVPEEIKPWVFVANGNVIVRQLKPAQVAEPVAAEKRPMAMATALPTPPVEVGRVPRWSRMMVAMPMRLRAVWTALTTRRDGHRQGSRRRAE